MRIIRALLIFSISLFGGIAAQSAERELLPASAKVVFLAYNNSGVGPQPYVTDGSSAGTRRIPLPYNGKDFNLHRLPGRVAMCWQSKDAAGSRIDYVSYVALNGNVEHWQAPPSSAILKCQAVGYTFYFIVLDSALGSFKLYASNGTSASTRLIGALPNSTGWRVFPFNGAHYLTTYVPNFPPIQTVYRITTNGPVRAFEYNLSQSRICCGNWETQVGSRLLYAGWNRWNGVELWSTDGTNAGRTLVKSISPGQADGIEGGFATAPLVAGGKLIFLATDPLNGTELWSSDGTNAGTVRLTSFPSDQGIRDAYTDERIMMDGGKAYIAVSNFYLNRQGGYGASLFVTDGSPTGTRRLPLWFGGKELLVFDRGAIAGGWLYTRAMQYDIPGCKGDLSLGDETAKCNDALYRYNLTTRIVERVADINPTYVDRCRTACDFSYNFTAVGNGLIFGAADTRSASNPPVFNTEPWSTLGTAATTTKIKEIAPSVVGSSPFAFTPLVP